MNLAKEIDDRTVAEQLRDLGVPFAAGLKEGLYEPKRARGGWVGVPVA